LLGILNEAEHALRFIRERKKESHALFEDDVKLIADLLQTTREARTTDISSRFGVSQPCDDQEHLAF
jgi:DtxR family manganese transport transcriptional regulator